MHSLLVNCTNMYRFGLQFSSKGSSKQEEILSYIRKGVDVYSFFQPFRAQNNYLCKGFEEFITSTILARVRNGSLIALGKVGEVPPPHSVLPLTVEPSKPRLCHDERFLNLWIKDLPFSLDKITDLPRYVGKDHYQTVMDDKSGYDHVSLLSAVRSFLGFNGPGGTFASALSRLVGRQVRTFIIPSAWPLPVMRVP